MQSCCMLVEKKEEKEEKPPFQFQAPSTVVGILCKDVRVRVKAQVLWYLLLEHSGLGLNDDLVSQNNHSQLSHDLDQSDPSFCSYSSIYLHAGYMPRRPPTLLEQLTSLQQPTIDLTPTRSSCQTGGCSW